METVNNVTLVITNFTFVWPRRNDPLLCDVTYSRLSSSIWMLFTFAKTATFASNWLSAKWYIMTADGSKGPKFFKAINSTFSICGGLLVLLGVLQKNFRKTCFFPDFYQIVATFQQPLILLIFSTSLNVAPEKQKRPIVSIELRRSKSIYLLFQWEKQEKTGTFTSTLLISKRLSMASDLSTEPNFLTQKNLEPSVGFLSRLTAFFDFCHGCLNNSISFLKALDICPSKTDWGEYNQHEVSQVI